MTIQGIDESITREPEMLTIAQFIDLHGITMKVRRAKPRALDIQIWDGRKLDHWQCTLTCGQEKLPIRFSQGTGHEGNPPELATVLDCLAAESTSYENAPKFEDWCSEYGYDADSRRIERVYKAVKKQSEQLAAFLGGEACNQLLWEVEGE